jgi:transposase InsO family protein
MGKRTYAQEAGQVAADMEGAMTMDEFNEAAKELTVLRAEVVEVRGNLVQGTVDEKREARADLQIARAALAKAEAVVASVAARREFTFELGIVLTGDAPLINQWVRANPAPPLYCDPNVWKEPPTEPLKPTTLAKVKWGEWRRHLVTACLVPIYEPKRSRGVITETGSMDVGPYGPLPTVSAKGKAMFSQLKERVRLDSTTGALYYTYYDETMVNKKRILADEGEKRQMFLKYWHDSEVCAHRGRDSTFEKLTASFFNLTRAEVEMLIRETEVYQVSSKTKNKEKVTNPLMTSRPMEHLQMDLVDFHQYKTFNKNITFLLVVVDCFSKFLWAFPLLRKAAPEVLSKLRALFMTEGIPTILQSDNGTEFVSEKSRDYYERCGIVFRTGRAYKPSSQGQVERTNRTLKAAIYHDILATDNYDWVTNLDMRVFSYNTLTQTSAGLTPFEIHRGRKMTWMSDSKDRTVDNASVITLVDGFAGSLTQRERELIAKDERLLRMLTDKTPAEIRDYMAVSAEHTRPVAIDAMDAMEKEEETAVEEEEDDEVVVEEEEDPRIESLPSGLNSVDTGLKPDGCQTGYKRPRNDPDGECEKERETKVPAGLADYVLDKPPVPKKVPNPKKKTKKKKK